MTKQPPNGEQITVADVARGVGVVARGALATLVLVGALLLALAIFVAPFVLASHTRGLAAWMGPTITWVIGIAIITVAGGVVLALLTRGLGQLGRRARLQHAATSADTNGST